MTSIKQPSSKSKKKLRKAKLQNAKASKRGNNSPPANTAIGPDNWSAWCKYLAKRAKPQAIHTILNGKTTPLAWGLRGAWKYGPTADLLSFLHNVAAGKSTNDAQVADRLEQWIASHDSRDCSVAFALECLAWCHALPELAGVLTAAPWNQLFELLVNVVESEPACDLQDDPLAHQLQMGELALTLAYAFPEQDRCAALWEPGRMALSYGLTELHDGEGLLHANDLRLLPSLLACWTRAETIARYAGSSAFDEEGWSQYEWLVRQAIRLYRWDGTLVFDDGETGAAWNKNLMTAALELNDDAADDVIASRVLPSLAKSKNVGSHRTKEIPEPTVYSEWSELCVARTEWKRNAPQMAIAFDDRSYRFEVSASREILWSGLVDARVTVNGDLREQTSDWVETCWFSDQDADYLEVECDLDGGWVIQRQVLLAREGKFVYFADNVIGKQAADVDYSVTLPLGTDVEFRPAGETHEGHLVGAKPAAIVIPLALPEWRSESGSGALTSEAGSLELTYNAHAMRLCVPLFVDLQPKHIGKEMTWRRLTVAEKLEIQGPDVAVGYRVQVGKAQWFVYRSLAPAANRTLLGQNLSNEFVCAKFRKDGTLDELIEIE